MKKFSSIIVAIVITLNCLFALGVLLVFWKTGGNEPTVLIGAWFTFTTGELWLLKDIKKTKIKSEYREGFKNDRKINQ